jgi:anti-sigma28 factor (negative regulator of flagellin synthesis)
VQISYQQVARIREAARQNARQQTEQPVGSVEELAARHGVRMDEVRSATKQTLMAEGDPFRERRLRDLARRISEGTYQVEAEDLVDMAERRAIADRAGDL